MGLAQHEVESRVLSPAGVPQPAPELVPTAVRASPAKCALSALTAPETTGEAVPFAFTSSVRSNRRTEVLGSAQWTVVVEVSACSSPVHSVAGMVTVRSNVPVASGAPVASTHETVPVMAGVSGRGRLTPPGSSASAKTPWALSTQVASVPGAAETGRAGAGAPVSGGTTASSGVAASETPRTEIFMSCSP
ncbi:hypothetical protein [Kitasatospora sp. NPDC017646]|uniref:hypothetical protein n=1 Tax=Kitasatospora sp. NPDC017646 TaxID=3364024 RepID=UPI0037A3D471